MTNTTEAALREALKRIKDMIPTAVPDYTHQVWKIADEALSQPSPASSTADDLLRQRDKFIVDQGLWTDFVSTLPKTAHKPRCSLSGVTPIFASCVCFLPSGEPAFSQSTPENVSKEGDAIENVQPASVQEDKS